MMCCPSSGYAMFSLKKFYEGQEMGARKTKYFGRILNFTCQVFVTFIKKKLSPCATFISSNKSTLLTVIFCGRFHDLNVTFPFSSFITHCIKNEVFHSGFLQ